MTAAELTPPCLTQQDFIVSRQRRQINGENSGTLETFMKKSNSSKVLPLMAAIFNLFNLVAHIN